MRVIASVLGHFGEGRILLNGQTVKTKTVTEELQNKLGWDQVAKIDTHGRWKALLKAPLQVFRALKNSENILIFPAQNGLRIYAPLLSFQRCFFRNRKIHYVVIGGWLPGFLYSRKRLSKVLKGFDGIYVETNTMKKALEAQGFGNVFLMPNFKNIRVLSPEELVYSSEAPYRLCTFSRVMKEKGIELAVDTVQRVNEKLGYTAFSLDIYGQVDALQREWFENIKSRFSNSVRYCGYVESDRSVDVLQQYFALVFPTQFYTEGIPGSIIDAYAAGVPVIAAKWESYSDVIDDGISGIGYDFDHGEDLERILTDVANEPEIMLRLKKNCIQKAKEFFPESSLQILFEQMKGN